MTPFPPLTRTEAATLLHLLLERNIQLHKHTTISKQLEDALLAIEQLTNNYKVEEYQRFARSGSIILLKHCYGE